MSQEIDNLLNFDKDDLSALTDYIGIEKLKSIIRKLYKLPEFKKIPYCKLDQETIDKNKKDNSKKATSFCENILFDPNAKNRDKVLEIFANKINSKMRKERPGQEFAKLSNQGKYEYIDRLETPHPYIKFLLKKLFSLSVSEEDFLKVKNDYIHREDGLEEVSEESNKETSTEADSKKLEELRKSNSSLNQKINDLTNQLNSYKTKYENLKEKIRTLLNDIPSKIKQPQREDLIQKIEEAVADKNVEKMKKIAVSIYLYASLEEEDYE